MPTSRPKPRKAPKQTRSLETVDAIVEAAARILEEHGHGGFSTNAIADRAGGLIVVHVLEKADLPPQQDTATAAQDIVAMLKGIVDAAGRVGERDADAVLQRAKRAIFGYLTRTN